LHFLLLYGFNSQSLNGVFGFLGIEVSFWFFLLFLVFYFVWVFYFED
jgi:hypothetical protein